MKKLLTLALATTLLLTLVACNSGETQTTTQTTTEETPADVVETTEENLATETTEATATDFDTTKNITVVAREDGSGTKSAFMDIIGLKGQPDPASVIIQPSTSAVNAEVSANKTAISYESLGFVSDDVKKLNVNGIEPTTENIYSGVYPISRPLAIIFLDETLEKDVCAAFFDFLQGGEADDIISNAGFVSLVNLVDTPAYTIDPDLAGTIEISGSTSVQPLMIELALAFEELQPNVTINVAGGGSGTGYNDAANGTSDFGMISEVFNPEKAPLCKPFDLAQDGIVVIVHNENPLNDISLEQLANIFDGEAATPTTVWSELF